MTPGGKVNPPPIRPPALVPGFGLPAGGGGLPPAFGSGAAGPVAGAVGVAFGSGLGAGSGMSMVWKVSFGEPFSAPSMAIFQIGPGPVAPKTPSAP